MLDLMMMLAMATSGQTPTPTCNQRSTVAIEDCQQRQLKTANVRLNAAYQARMVRLSPAERMRLRVEERQWITSRDAKCMVGPDQGTAGPIGAGNCLISETNARTRQLASNR